MRRKNQKWINKDKCPYFGLKDVIQGTFMMGTKKALSWWYNEYFMVHDSFIKYHLFVGKDQTIMTTVLLRNDNWKRILILDSSKAAECDQNIWAYFQIYFAINHQDVENLNDERIVKCQDKMGQQPIFINTTLISQYYIDHFLKCKHVLQ